MELIKGLTRRLSNLKDQYYIKSHPECLDWSDINVSLIVGSGRTGTGFFAQYFTQEFKDIVALHEPYPDLFQLGIRGLRENLSQEQVIAEIAKNRFKYKKELTEKGYQYFMESNNNYTMMLHHDLRKLFPNLKLIWVARHPKTYVRSCFSKMHGAKYRAFDENDGRDRLGSKDFDDEKQLFDWSNMDRFQKICWHWKKYNQMCLDAKNIYGDQMLFVKFEDLFSGEFEAMEKIINFLGVQELLNSDSHIEAMKTKANYSDQYIIDSYDDWSDEQIQYFHNTTDSLAIELGYTI